MYLSIVILTKYINFLYKITYCYIYFIFSKGLKEKNGGVGSNDKYRNGQARSMIFGMKMRFNEPFQVREFTPKMIELHLADEDLTVHRREIIDRISILPNVPIIVHAPMNLHLKLEHRPLVDIASENEKQRLMSLEVIRMGMDLLGDIEGEYLVLHPGGQTPQAHSDTNHLMGNLMGSLDTLERDYATKKMLMENMPWHYWMWGGEERWYSNILRRPEEFTPILEYTHACLDICHAYLADDEGSNQIIFDFLDSLRGRIKHVHLSDARAPDGEGLQFGEGDIELKRVFRRLLDLDVTVIPEIRGGHLEDRKGLYESIGRFNSIILGRGI